jgi:hypothetical protein
MWLYHSYNGFLIGQIFTAPGSAKSFLPVKLKQYETGFFHVPFKINKQDRRLQAEA